MTDMTRLQNALYNATPEEIVRDLEWIGMSAAVARLLVTDEAIERAAQAISNHHLSNTGVPFPIEACRGDARIALNAAFSKQTKK